ncbi:MAG: aminopeptidase N [Candidatus Malihini olakiniferum]
MNQPPKVKYRNDYSASNYTISDISLDFILNTEKTHVIAVSQIMRQGEADTPLSLNGEGLTLLSLKVNNQAWSHYKFKDGGLSLTQLPAAFTLSIETEINPSANSRLEGLYQSGDVLCTQCEAEGFRHITYYLDRPDILARFTTRITADSVRYPHLLSNGNCVAQGTMSNGQHWVEWYDPFPKPCYLFALVAGDFDVLRNMFITRSGREVVLKLYVNRGNLDRADWAMKSLKNAMKWDETRFGLEYDLDVYMIVAVDFFNMGAMENKGLNIFNSKYVLAKSETATDKDYLSIEKVIGHEYFHNWTGNRITCRDWFQLSLKEGLTIFRDQEFSSDLGSRSLNRINSVRVMRGAQFAEDASPISHPIRPDQVIEINNFYTLTVYEKGSEVIRMIHTLLGENRFQAGMRLYFDRYDGGVATCDDFIQTMEDASGIDLAQFRRWYSQSGTPVVMVRDNYNAATHQYFLTVTQNTHIGADCQEKYPLHIPLDVELYDENGKVIPLQHAGKFIGSVLNLTEKKQTFVFDNVPSQPIPSLLRGFSAPVKLNYPWKDMQLTFLMRHARNNFSRWDAAQSLLANHIHLNVIRYQKKELLSLPLHLVDAFREVLLSAALDPMLAAQILTLPSENEIAELFDCIDPLAISAVRKVMVSTLSAELADEWLAVYHFNKIPEYRIDHADIGRRSLRNTCLYYLSFCKMVQADTIVTAQYKQADNMTDSLAALFSAVSAQLPSRDALMADFDDRWHKDTLVIDKWFTLQATSPDNNVLSRVRKLLQHRSFSLNNPNRLYALVGAFSVANPAAFHSTGGDGYRFLTEILIDLNTRNPQVAARLIEPLIRLKRYNSVRQSLMCQSLEQLKKLDNLSNDLFEKIGKVLQG